MPTFLHTADLHLDSAFLAHFDAKGAKRRRNEMLHCVEDIINRAKDKDLLLIAGDLFDTSCITNETVAFLKRKFAEIPQTKVFIVAGNHDPYTVDSIYAKEDFGENVHIFNTEFECVNLPEIKTRVYGISFDRANPFKMNILPIKKEDGVFDILLLHADCMAADSAYNPIDKDFIRNCGADYLALGHIHKRSELLKEGSTYYAYSGTPFGRGFDETGDVGVYEGEFSNGVLKIQFESTSKRRMFREEIDVTESADNLFAVETVKKFIASIGGTYDDIYKIILIGRVNSLDIDIIKEELSKLFYHIELVDKTKPCYDVEKLSLGNDLCGEFIRRMKNEINKAEDKELFEDALMLGIDALLGGDSV